eukprot:GHVS01085670.1.p1 GENE.GHVS01085670.1~~GHVS01085670.1.p1  ORF type:complete len:450 (-),score=34.87 GHVS01085670.1:436-1785(-)
MRHRGIVPVLWAGVLVCHYALRALGNEFFGGRINGATASLQPSAVVASSSASRGRTGKGSVSKGSGCYPSILGFVRGPLVTTPWGSPTESRASGVGRRAKALVGSNEGGTIAWSEGRGRNLSAVDCKWKTLLRAVGVDRLAGRGFIVDDKGTITATGGLEGGVRRVSGPVHEATVNSLEVDPYHDILTNIPINTIKHKNPLVAHLKRVQPLVTSDGQPAICHVELNLEGKMRYWEGQAIGIMPPGTNSKTGKPNSVRLYSIASTRYGDDGDGRTVSLCVRRAVHIDPLTGKQDEEKEGLCSKLLCMSAPETPFNVVGPSGKVMLLPEATPCADVIMVATGTGIAPFRGFWRRLFVEDTPAARAFSGLAWLLLGVPDRQSALYQNEWTEVQAAYRDKFRLTCAFSREMTTPSGDKMYIQVRDDGLNDQELFLPVFTGSHRREWRGNVRET